MTRLNKLYEVSIKSKATFPPLQLLIDVKDAAMLIGDPNLQEKMMLASTAIKRDIVFAASLYTTGKDSVII